MTGAPEKKPEAQTREELLARIAEINRQILATQAAKKAACANYNDTIKGYRLELEGCLEQLGNLKEG